MCGLLFELIIDIFQTLMHAEMMEFVQQQCKR